MKETIENDIGRFWLDDDGVLNCVATAQDQTAQQAREALRIFSQVAGGARRPAVIDMSRVKGLSREARAIYAGKEAADIWTAVALVVSYSTLARALVNFVVTVSRPEFPTKMFDTVEDARSWARTHVHGG